MLILAVDTTTKTGSLALLQGCDVLGSVAADQGEPYSSGLFRELQILLPNAGVTLDKVNLYAVAAGPGSFTGLRVGLTAVKGWAEVYDAPIAAVSALEAVAAQVRVGDSLVAAVMDAHRGQVFGGIYELVKGRLLHHGDDVVAAPEEYLRLVRAQADTGKVAFATPTPEVIAGALANSEYRDARVERVSSLLAPAVGRLGFQRALRGELVNALSLEAHYVRRSDAELLWKGL